MKTLISIMMFIGVVLLTGNSDGRGETETNRTAATGSSTNTTVYTLSTSDQDIKRPTVSDIRKAVESRDVEKGNSFVVLSRTEMAYIQVYGDPKEGFDLEYQERDRDHHYQANRKFKADEVIRLFVSYMKGDTDWNKDITWKKMAWQ